MQQSSYNFKILLRSWKSTHSEVKLSHFWIWMNLEERKKPYFKSSVTQFQHYKVFTDEMTPVVQPQRSRHDRVPIVQACVSDSQLLRGQSLVQNNHVERLFPKKAYIIQT